MQTVEQSIIQDKREDFRINLRRQSIESEFNFKRWKLIDSNKQSASKDQHSVSIKETLELLYQQISSNSFTSTIDGVSVNQKIDNVSRESFSKIQMNRMNSHSFNQNFIRNKSLNFSSDDIILSIDFILRQFANNKKDHEQIFEAIIQILFFVVEYLHDSLQNISLVIKKKSILNLIIQLCISDKFQWKLFPIAMIALDSLSKGTQIQKTEIYTHYPSLLFQVVSLLSPNQQRISTKRTKVKIFQVLSNFFYEPSQSLQAHIFGDGIAKQFIALSIQEAQVQNFSTGNSYINKEILYCCTNLMSYSSDEQLEIMFQNGLLYLVLDGLDYFHYQTNTLQTLECLQLMLEWQQGDLETSQNQTNIKEELNRNGSIYKIQFLMNEYRENPVIYSLAENVLSLIM